MYAKARFIQTIVLWTDQTQYFRGLKAFSISLAHANLIENYYCYYYYGIRKSKEYR